MNLRQIKYFVAVYEEGSFSKAAKRENCAQPGLSNQIRLLEESLSNKLFDRSVHGTDPTEAGQEFYHNAVSILKSVQATHIHMQELSGEISGLVTAGLIPSVVRGLLPSFLPGFVDKYPHIKLNISEAYSDALTNWVSTGILDFAVVIDPPTQEGLDIETISHEKMVMISGRKLKLKSWAPIKMAEMPLLKYVLPSQRNGLRINLNRFIHSGEIKAEKIIEMDAMQGSIEFVRNTDWATILPFTAVIYEAEDKSLCFNPIVEPDIQSNFFLIHQKQYPLSVAARTFVNALKNEVQVTANAWKTYVQ